MWYVHFEFYLQFDCIQFSYYCFSATYKQAKEFVAKNRKLNPINYSEIENEKGRPKRCRRRLNNYAASVAKVKEQLKIKIERITRFKKALCILNRQNDKQRIEKIDASDVEEFDELLSEGESETIEAIQEIPRQCVAEAVPSQSNNAIYCVAGPSHLAFVPMQSIDNAMAKSGSYSPLQPNENAGEGFDNDDLIEIGSSGNNAIIRTGVDPVLMDRTFSLEYSYTTNVSKIECQII